MVWLWTRRPLSPHRSGYFGPGYRIAARCTQGTPYPGWDPKNPCQITAGRGFEARVWVTAPVGIDKGGGKVPSPRRRHVGAKQAS